MNWHSGRIWIGLCGILAVILGFNGVWALLAPDGKEVIYILHLILLPLIIVGVIYLQNKLWTLRHKLAVHCHALRQVPCGIAVFRDDTLQEVCAAAELFHTFGLGKNENRPDETSEDTEADRLVQTEEQPGQEGRSRYADRYIIWPRNFNSARYRVEVLLEATQRIIESQQRETDWVNMIRILVNMFEIKDPYSHGHSEIVSNLAQELAKALNLSKQECGTIGKAALLHDIGKIIIPAEILGKAGELSSDERELIKAHATVGADILAGMSLFTKEAAIVRHHHERFDGNGYPLGIAGEDIPHGSRIIAVVDAFDAMTAGRSVRHKYDVETTLTVLTQEKGRHFDPGVVEAFKNMVQVERATKQ